jgi:hypothetical protein
MRLKTAVALTCAVVLVLAGCSRKGSSTHTLAFITNNASDFWTIARKGTEKADAERTDITVEFRLEIPPQEALDGCTIARRLLRQELERHVAVQRGVLGAIDDAHATTAETFEDPVMRDGLADQGASWGDRGEPGS